MRIREYITALWADWLVLMSGSASVILAFWAAYFPPSNIQAGRTLLWIASVACFVVASYRIWARERDAREKEIAQLKISHQAEVKEKDNTHKSEIEQKEKEHKSEQSKLTEGHVNTELAQIRLHKKEVEGLKKNSKSIFDGMTRQMETERERYKTQESELRATIDSLNSRLVEKPNLICSCIRLAYVRPDGRGVIRDGGAKIAIVAEFENKADPPRKVSSAESVIARIHYYTTDGKLYDSIKGAWVTEEYNCVGLAVGDTRRLLIATKMSSRLALNYQNNNDSPERRYGLSALRLTEEQYTVYVELIPREHSDAKRDFKFELTLEPELSLVWIEQ